MSKRGPYFKYLNSSQKIPKQTLWNKRRKLMQNPIENSTNEIEEQNNQQVYDSDSSDENDFNNFFDIEDYDSDEDDVSDDEENEHSVIESSEEINNNYQENEQNVLVCDNINFDEHEKIHENLTCTVKEAINIINAYAIRRNANWAEIVDLIHLVNTIVGENKIPASKYLFKKKFLDRKSEFTVHICCSFCTKYLGKKDDLIESNQRICDHCENQIDISTKYKKNYFITIPTEQHIKSSLERNKQNLRLKRTTLESGTICDVHDSNRFQNMHKIMQNSEYVTLTVNTDGAAVFKSTKDKSFWPLQYSINEVDIKYRFKRENMLVAGFAFGKKPNMSVFYFSVNT